MGDGVGFVFSTHDPYSGIDLDGCRDPETGEIEPWAEEWIRRCDSYTEVSPSGAGVHIIVRAKLPPGRRRRGGIEVYEEGRYFTVTGDRLRNTPTTVEERTDVLTRLHAETFPPPPPSTVEAKRAASPVSLSDHELIEQARSARNGQKFSALWNGDTSGYDSPSEADLALCSELAFWTGPDAVRIDALFRQSSLYWDKWDERRGQQTYGEMTVARALEGRTEFFTPRAPAGAQDPATSPPTIGRSVGGEALEASGSELIASAEHASDLPMLPMLGQRKYLVEGWSHLLAGYPRSGKTELLFRAIREWLDEGHSVVYLTEEPRSIWEQRLRHRQDDWSNLQVVFALGTPPEVLFRRAFEGGEEIVIVDTLRNLLNLRDETDNSEVARVLNPWVAGSRRTEKTLIMAHHMRKGGGQHGEGISGGHALLGVFDIALELGRDDHHAARRTIKGYARLIETPEMVYERSEDGTFRALGDPEQLRLSEVRDRVEAVLSDDWGKTKDVLEALDEPRPGQEQVRLALGALARAGMAERDPPIEQDAPGKTHRWRRTTSPPTDLPMVGGEVASDDVPNPPPIVGQSISESLPTDARRVVEV